MSKKCISCGTPPQPYYVDENNSLTQDHAAIFRDTQFAAGIYLAKEFVVPAIDTDIQIQTKNLINIVVGSYLWSPAYGYLKIVHWDECTGKLGLLNEDISGAAIPGTVVSEGSLWAVAARPCCADQDTFSLFPFLAEDYVIPAVSGAVTLAVTSTFGLIQGSTVRIGSNVYFLSQINSSLEVIVTNQGAGGVPGTIVSARDINGELQYLITQAVTSACSSTGVDTVKLIGCDGINERVLTGEYATQVPVLQSSITSEVSFQLLDTEVRTCTFLTASVNILSATDSYTINVDDESVFNIGQIVQLGFGSLRWEITDNTTPGDLDIICTIGNPGSSFTIPNGSSVCLQLTPEALEEDIVALQARLTDIAIGFKNGVTAGSAAITGINSYEDLPNAPLVRACVVTHLTAIIGKDEITSGTLTITLYKNGVTTGQAITITSATDGGFSNYGAITPVSFAVGDKCDFAITKAAIAIAGNIAIVAKAVGYYT